MKLIQFKDVAAQSLYNSYMEQCKKTIKILSEADKEDCLLEVNSYIYEFLNSNQANSEIQNITAILDRLGNPKEMLKEVIVAKKMAQAIKTFNPKYFFQALFLNLKKGTIYTIFSLLILILLCLPVLLVIKVIFPKKVGLFIGEHNFILGFANVTNNTTEMLGNWFLPVAFLLIGILYFSAIYLLKSVKKTALNIIGQNCNPNFITFLKAI